jgi:opacity protein-like surface antigen
VKRTALAAILLSLTCLTPAHAEWYVAGDVLWTTYQGPQVDGTWTQEQLPSQRGIPAVRQTKESMAWDVGAGYRFTDGEAWYSKGLSLEAGYRHYGAGVSAGGLAVSDAVYGDILNGEHPRYKASEYEATTHMEGGYLRVAKGFDVGYGVEPYVSGGIEVLYQETDFWNKSQKGKTQTGGFTGIMAAVTAGGGFKYHVGYGVKARVGAESHWVITESGHPISSQWLTVGGGIEVPLDVFANIPGSTRDYLWQR